MQCSDYNTIYLPELKDMFLRIILLLLFSVSASLGHITDSIDVTLANEDSQPGILVGQIEELTSLSDENQGLAERVDVTSLAIEESEEKMKRDEKSLIVWRLINIAAGSFLVIVFINLTAMLTILLGWNLLA